MINLEVKNIMFFIDEVLDHHYKHTKIEIIDKVIITLSNIKGEEMKLNEEMGKEFNRIDNYIFNCNQAIEYKIFCEKYIPKVEILEKQNKNTTENLIRAKQILSELREQLEYEQKQNEQLQKEKNRYKEGMLNYKSIGKDYIKQNKKLHQEKKELILYKKIVTILEGSYYNCQGCSINTPDILLKDLILDIKKQLLSKIKE